VLEAINTLATVATLVVLTAGAIAASIQLRHMRTGNELQAFIDIYARAQSPEMQKLFDALAFEVPQLARDPEYVRKLAAGELGLQESPLLLGFWFDEVGVTLNEGLIRDRVIFQIGASASTTVRAWQALYPLVQAVRTRAPAAFIYFEYAAVRAQQWLDAYPDGDYPRGVPRWEQLESLRLPSERKRQS
jgi:hypothetical protein